MTGRTGGSCRFSAGRDPRFSKPFPRELSPRLRARRVATACSEYSSLRKRPRSADSLKVDCSAHQGAAKLKANFDGRDYRPEAGPETVRIAKVGRDGFSMTVSVNGKP